MRAIFPAALALLLWPAAGWAGLEICNDSEARQSVAVGYKSGEVWVSEGWWNVSPGDCVEPVRGDLKSRYYYLRIQARGWIFDHEQIPFCTTRRAFTIEGDADCAARGFDKRYFRKIDTGKTARHFKVGLAAFTRPDPVEPGHKAQPAEERAAAPEPVGPPVKRRKPAQAGTAPRMTQDPGPAPAAFAPGTHGEPWDGRGIVQGCEVLDGYDHCAFYAEGTKFMVPRVGPSDRGARNVLAALDPGTPVMVAGDIVAFFDRSVEFAIGTVSVAEFGRLDVMMHDLQGAWYAVDDPASQFTVLGSERVWTYDGAEGTFDNFRLGTSCNRHSGATYIISTDPEIGDTLCYSIERLDGRSLVVMYVDNGNVLEYRKLD